tara:strand:+ start:1225 stop:2790 length:1566 start_codon:yes stop_codon:yes gene_type:complete
MKITLLSIYPDIHSYGVRILSSVLKKEGHSVDIIFLTKEFWQRFDKKTLDDVVKLAKGSDLIGISLMSNFWDNAIHLTNKFREHYNTPIMWGGTHPTVRPDECLEHADMVCISESEEPVVELTRRMTKGLNYTDIKGMGFRTKEKIINNGHGPLPGSKDSMFKHLDEVPHQDYDWKNHYILKDDRVVNIDMEILNKFSDTYMTMPTRGCPFACTFCVNSEFLKMYPHQKPIRMRTVDNIIDELNLVKKTMPFVKQILFNDDAFFLMPVAMIKDFSKKYEEQIKMPLIITGATPSTLSKTKLSILADAGLVGLRMGIQTLAENSKKLYKRPHSNAAIMAAVKVINEQKERVNVNYDFILESPWDTDDNTIETLRFVAQIPPPYNLNLFRLVFFPGTDLYMRAKKEGIVKNDIEDIYRRHYGDESLKRTYLTQIFYTLSDYGAFGKSIPYSLIHFITNRKKWLYPLHKLILTMLQINFRLVRRVERLKLKLSRLSIKMPKVNTAKKEAKIEEPSTDVAKWVQN